MPKEIVQSTEAYEENWLARELKRKRLKTVKKDIVEKHEKMSSGALPFLRATYWRWAEIADKFCPPEKSRPRVLAVGDIHIENYGTWRDGDGRLVWGVNDFDEAAYMSYELDLVRLATSAAVAPHARIGLFQICVAILEGYEDGLKHPAPFVLERDHAWLREKFEVGHIERADFWAKIDKKLSKASESATKKGEAKEKRSDEAKDADGGLPLNFRMMLDTAMPKKGLDLKFWRSGAGTGSLGRPRWRACAEWREAPVLREVKALIPSAWIYAHGGKRVILAQTIAAGRYRAPDPIYRADAEERIAIRRLSANSRKLEMDYHEDILLDPRMLGYMGQELANVHLGTADTSKKNDILADLKARPSDWLLTAVETASDHIRREHESYERYWRKSGRKARSAAR